MHKIEKFQTIMGISNYLIERINFSINILWKNNQIA